MGQEITSSRFKPQDYIDFKQRLTEETSLLSAQLSEGVFSSESPVAGFEIEAWLVDEVCRPVAENERFLETFNNPLATAELAKFNVELNNDPAKLNGTALSDFETSLQEVFTQADSAAQSIEARLLMTGTLPTVKSDDFGIENMSDLNRYRALNEQVLLARDYAPIELDITGSDHLKMSYDSVMMEAATTSFQIHTQVPWKEAHHYYNAAMMASAASVAISANSPFLFNKKLWDETRIPLFEQSVNTGKGNSPRVTFGSGYAQESILECFEENLRDYPVLIPMVFDAPNESFSHLKLHNGVVWRWNRPLIGSNEAGVPHVRIEHRVMPAGPTIVDMVANAAFYYGLSETLKNQLLDGEKLLDFDTTKNNFYAAAEEGLNAEVVWNGRTHRLQNLIQASLLPLAEKGLISLGIDSKDISKYLAIIAERAGSGQTGAAWQRKHLIGLNGDFQKLTEDYFSHHHTGKAVHTWNTQC